MTSQHLNEDLLASSGVGQMAEGAQRKRGADDMVTPHDQSTVCRGVEEADI
jgi:hypothetical protein